MLEFLRVHFWKLVLAFCLLATIIGLFIGEWDLMLPTLWGIFLYKRDIDNTLNETDDTNEIDDNEEIELNEQQTLIVSLCNMYIDDEEKAYENYEFLDSLFLVAGDKEQKCHWCEKDEIMFEFVEDENTTDLVCMRCMIDYVVGWLEDERDKLSKNA